MSTKVEDNVPVVSLPLDELPSEWKDEARLNVFFGPFRNRNVNAKDFDSKLDFWKKTICVYCTCTKTYSFKLNDLEKAFRTKGRSPTCLNIVIEQMYKNKEIVPIEEFSLKASDTWSGWATDVFIKKPIYWSFNKLKSTVTSPNLSDKVFVHVEVLENESKQLLTSISDENRNRVIEIKDFLSMHEYTEPQAKLLLHFLVCRGEVSVREVKNNDSEKEPIMLIKFCDKKKNISDTDVDIYMLQKTEAIFMKTLEKLEGEVISLIADAKGYLVKGAKQTAKTCLRKKRDLEKRIEGRANALHNVQILLSRVEDASHDTEVLETYKSALSSLRSNFKDDKLSEEVVANTMIEIGEVLEIHDDIQSTLAQSINTNDEDLEAELEALLAADDGADNSSPKPSDTSPKPATSPRTDKEIKELKLLDEQFKYMQLPDVPTSEPFSTPTKLSI